GVAAGEQLFVAALVYQPSAAKDEDAVGPANLAEAVGDQESGPTFHDAAHGALDLVFGRAVDGAGRVVEDEDPRIGQERASDGDALSLPPGEGDAPLADLGLVAIRQGGDELMGLGETSGLLDRLGAGLARRAEGNVLADGTRE